MVKPTPIRAHRRYTRRQKAEAVGIAAVEGVTRAGEVTGIAKQTIDYWLKDPAFGQLRTTAREVVVDQFWVGIQVGIKEVTAGLTGDAPLKDKAAATVALVEKHALLSGQATSRTETRSLAEGLSDHERETLADILREAIEEKESA